MTLTWAFRKKTKGIGEDARILCTLIATRSRGPFTREVCQGPEGRALLPGLRFCSFSWAGGQQAVGNPSLMCGHHFFFF